MKGEPAPAPLDLEDGRWSATLAADGTCLCSAEMMRALGFEAGERLVFRPTEQGVVVTSVQKTIAQLQAMLARTVPRDVSLVDELIAERKVEAARE